MNKIELLKNILLLIILFLISIISVTGFAMIENKKNPPSYYEPDLSPEEVIEKYYDAYNSHNEEKMQSTLTESLKDDAAIYKKLIHIKICTIEENEEKKDNYIEYDSCPIDNIDNLKAYRITYQEIDLRNNNVSDELWTDMILMKENDDSGWLISNIEE